MIKIVQCWDDGVVDDIRLIELLRRHKAKASFNLNPGMHGEGRGHTWRYEDTKDVSRLAKNELLAVYEGFTIANHTVNHPWPLKIGLAEWRREVFDGRKMLQDIFSQAVDGFVYPYGQRSDETDDVVREAGHTYARGTGPVCAEEPPGFPPSNPMRFVPDCHFKDPAFLEKIASAKASGAPVFYFWGHSYEMITEEEWARMDGLLQTLSEDPDAVWADLSELFVNANS
jgi:peptidoglycan/xylan/chitin deacetylase (PgdA/CDA1 family)